MLTVRIWIIANHFLSRSTITTIGEQMKLAEKSVMEEENLASRSLDEDKRRFQDITNEIKEKLLEILSIKTENKELVSSCYRL